MCLHCISGFGRRGLTGKLYSGLGFYFCWGYALLPATQQLSFISTAVGVASGVCLLGLGFYYNYITISWECEYISLSPAVIVSMQLLTITSSLLLFNVNSLHCPSIVFASQKGNGTNIPSPASADTYSVSWRWWWCRWFPPSRRLYQTRNAPNEIWFLHDLDTYSIAPAIWLMVWIKGKGDAAKADYDLIEQTQGGDHHLILLPQYENYVLSKQNNTHGIHRTKKWDTVPRLFTCCWNERLFTCCWVWGKFAIIIKTDDRAMQSNMELKV